MPHYEAIYNEVTKDKFYIRDKHSIMKFYDIVITEQIKNELDRIGVENVEYIPMKSINHTKGEAITGVYKLKIKTILVFYTKLDSNKIPDDIDIACDSETPCRLFI